MAIAIQVPVFDLLSHNLTKGNVLIKAVPDHYMLDKPPPLAQTLRTLNLSTLDNRLEPLEASVPVGHPVFVGKTTTVSSGPPPNVLDVMVVLRRVMEDDV